MTAAALEPRDRIDRMRSRSWALQVLYRWESGGRVEPLPEVLEEILRTRVVSVRRVPALGRLVERVWAHLDGIDAAIEGAMENWRMDRLSTIDRSVLRIATAEILFSEETPPKVAIQEGIRLAGQYGGDESSRFVNGVLDAVFRSAGRST
ncbi:MAG: transcription antitermination factor NusB [Gemmatimonadota bacterium]